MHPSKILLFGEYTILLNSYALAIPYIRLKGELAFMDAPSGKEHGEQVHSNHRLKEFLIFSKQSDINRKLTYPLDFVSFDKDIENGLYFKSDIPEESGLGSSGALIAAIFHKYSDIPASGIDILKIRNCLALLESYFHNNSSGIDPLVSYLKTPLLIRENEISITNPHQIEKSLQEYGLFLVNSRIKRKTGELVKKYNRRCLSDHEYISKTEQEYIPVNNECIMSLSESNNAERFFSAIRKLTLIQLEIFNEMIPEKIIQLTHYGVEKDLFYLKLCGSGGGGYFLGFTKDISQTESFFNERGYQILVY
jgi:mevalonate kinase